MSTSQIQPLDSLQKLTNLWSDDKPQQTTRPLCSEAPSWLCRKGVCTGTAEAVPFPGSPRFFPVLKHLVATRLRTSKPTGPFALPFLASLEGETRESQHSFRNS